MTRGLHAAAAGMLVQLGRQDILANNLANAGTVGYRRSDLSIGQSFAEALGRAGALPGVRATTIDVSPGAIHETGDVFDLAIDGPGLFTLQTDRGLRYTRDGRMRVAPDGHLLSASGHQVTGRAGPIVLPGPEFLVSARGQVFSEGQFVDELFIAQFDAPDALRRDTDGLFIAGRGPRMAESPHVLQGYLEEANVSVVREMTQMMTGFRAFEAGAAVLRQTDETLGTLIQSAGS